MFQAAQLLSQVDDIDPSPLNADMFECPLCYRLLHCPVTTPCGHVFCQHCLHRSMDHSMDCPQCRGSLSSVSIISSVHRLSTPTPSCRRRTSTYAIALSPPQYVAHRHKAVTMSIQRILQLWFSKEVDDREKVHQEEITSFTAWVFQIFDFLFADKHPAECGLINIFVLSLIGMARWRRYPSSSVQSPSQQFPARCTYSSRGIV